MAIIDDLNNLQTSIVTVKKVLADNIKAKGVSVSENDTLTTLSNAVKDIPQEGGGDIPQGSGISFDVIGYPVTPQYIQDGIDYAKTIYDNWDASITSCKDKYKGDTQLVYFPLVDTSNVTDMSSMFSGCTSLQYVPQINTSNVTTMSYMFNYCNNLTSLDLSGWDTSNVTFMYNMFNYCSGLISLDLSSFDTSNITAMSGIFGNCSGLTSLDLSNWDTSNVTNMSYLFTNCSGLTSLDLSSFDTSNVTNMNYMFNGCYTLQRIDGFLDWSKISSYPTNFIISMSPNPLRYMTIKNLGTTGTTFNFSTTHLQNWGDESDTTTYPLSVGARQSLVDSLLTYSYDRAANGLSNATIKLYSKVKARLTEDEITAIQNKGYTIS